MIQKLIASTFFLLILGASTVGFLASSIAPSNSPTITVNHLPMTEFSNELPDATYFESIDLTNENSNYQSININLLERLLENLEFDWVKNGIIAKRAFFTDKTASTINHDHWQFDPHNFQKIFLKLVANKIDFMNLRLEFRYDQDYKRVSIAIGDQDHEDNVIYKQYSISEGN